MRNPFPYRTTRLAVLAGVVVASSLAYLVGGGGRAAADSRLIPGEQRCFGVNGEPGQIAVVNLTPVLASGAGDGKLLPSGATPEGPVSNVNFGRNTVDPNVAFTEIGADGRVCFHNSIHSSLDLIADQLGTITDASFTYRPGSNSADGGPYRILDTRKLGTKIKPNERRCFAVPGGEGWGALVNLTPVLADGAGDGRVTMNATGLAVSVGSNVNFRRGTVDPNVAFAQAGAATSAGVCYVNSKHTSVDLIVDSLGSISATSFAMADASTGTSVRALDTRSGAKIQPNERRCFAVSGEPGQAAMINLTPVSADGFGDGKVISSDVVSAATTSNVNFGPNTVDPNLAIATIGRDGKVCYINSKHTSVHLIADHLATLRADAYTPAQADGAPLRMLDTRKTPTPVTTTTRPPTMSTSTTTRPPTVSTSTTTPRPGCDPSYPDVCIPPAPPDLNCPDIEYRDFRVLAPDPHGFDRNNDGIGCES